MLFFFLIFRKVFNDVRINSYNQELDMSKENKKRLSDYRDQIFKKYSIGIDISKKKFDVCISTIDNNQTVKVLVTRSFKNTDSGCLEFYQWQ